MLFLFVEPFITALSALFECTSHTGEQFPIEVAVIVLIVFLSPCAVAGVKHLVLFSAGSGGCAYSVGGHSRSHSNAVLVFYNQYPIFKRYIGVGYLPLFQPKVVTAVAIDEVSVKVVLVGKIGYYLP